MRRLRSLACIATDQPSINSGLSFIKRGSQYTLRTRSDSGSDIAYYGQCGQAVADRWLKSADSHGFKFSKSAHLWSRCAGFTRQWQCDASKGVAVAARVFDWWMSCSPCSSAVSRLCKTDNTPDARLSTTRMSTIADSSLQTSDWVIVVKLSVTSGGYLAC